MAGLSLLCPVTRTYAQGRGNPNPRIAPPNSRPHGHSYGEWGAKFWQAAFAIPIEDGDHPLFSGGAFGGDDGVLFIAAPFGGATIELTIPTGTPLFFPIVNAECSVLEPDPFHGDDEETLRECANGHIDLASDLSVEIDGVEVVAVGDYRTQSPLFEFGPLPENNVFGAPPGTTSLAVDAGVYLFLAPLSRGEHVIHLGGFLDEFGGLIIDTTYRITVVPGKP
jgi:hypothetical protein